MSQYDMPFRMVKAGGANTAVFVNIEDCAALDNVHVSRGNQELVISVAFYESADPSSRCTYALCFHIRSSSLEKARQSALEVVYYLAENCGIPPESVDLNYNAAVPAEIVVLVPPSVFDGRPTPLVPALNYDLARQMRDVGVENLNTDVYLRQHFVPLPNSTNETAGRFVIPLRMEELLYLDAKAIFEMSKQPRPDDSYTETRRVPEAAEWSAEALAEKEKQVRQQSHLRDKLLGRWVVPPCIRRLDWADTSEDNALEACRIIARFYPFIGAGEDESWYHIRRIDQRHSLQQGARLRAIVTFGNENPAFVGCDHPLVRQFCPADGCFMNELMNEIKNPRLFT